MVENPKGCVLQWAGHAGYVTERFSGLLARQALVDVTLVCEEQKLRVHKLVLASNSIYFEEILQQDLGQEPVIYLKDLNFEILKAMVEFMYCGETTISHQLLPSLLDATKTFKVKQLASVIDTMMTSNSTTEDFEISTNIQKDLCGSKMVNTTLNNTDCIPEKYDELEEEECSLLCDTNSNNVDKIKNHSFESNIIMDTVQSEVEHTLYEETQDLSADEKEADLPFLPSKPIEAELDKSSVVPTQCKVNNVSSRCSESSTTSDDIYYTDDELKPMLYEQCCDLSDVEDCERTSVSLSRSCLQQIEKDLAQYSFETRDVPRKVGKCVKVYTHKRRKSTDELKSKLIDMNSIMPNPPPTDCIDLLDEPSSNDIPVTLLTSLDMESAEYIISLSTENIQSIVGATVNDQHTFIKCKEIKHIIGYNDQKVDMDKQETSLENSDRSNCAKPILRRSLRLNQQENDETTNNNDSGGEFTTTEKNFKKSCSPNRTESCAKGRRRTKDMDRKVPEQTINSTTQPAKKNVSGTRSHRSSTKLIVKRNNKSAYTISSKEKDEQKVRTSSKVKCEMLEKVVTNNSVLAVTKLNTIEHINRALWGDMSDIFEDSENRLDLADYTPHTEIPFAVGLLPLRTALEKMQATPDHQPRKTRSSVAPMRNDINNLKRKNHVTMETAIATKKQYTNTNDTKGNAKTVCHIQIRTAPSQYIRGRKKFLSPDISALESSTVINRQ